MLHVPVMGTGTEHIVQVINVFISFTIDLDDRSSCIFPSILQMWPKCQKGYNTIQILNQTWCSHVMEQLQIIILSKLYLHVIYIPLPLTHTLVKGWGCIQEFHLSTTSLLNSLTPPKLVIGIQLSLQGGFCNSLPCAPSIYLFFILMICRVSHIKQSSKWEGSK